MSSDYTVTHVSRLYLKPNYHAALAYAEMQILEPAVEDAGSVCPQKVRDALASIAAATVMGSYKADAPGLNARERLSFQIQNGNRMIVWPKHAAETKYLLAMLRWEERLSN